MCARLAVAVAVEEMLGWSAIVLWMLLLVLLVLVRREWYLIAVAISFARLARLDAVPAFDYVRFQGDWSWTAMQFEEEATGVTQNRAGLVAAPERCRRRGAVLTNGLHHPHVSSQCSHIPVYGRVMEAPNRYRDGFIS